MEKEKEIHWSELFGNPLSYALHPAMLSDEGYKIKTVAPLKGESKAEEFAVTVVFDESYVIAKLSKILEQLQPQKYNDFQAVISKAYAEWNKKKKGEL